MKKTKFSKILSILLSVIMLVSTCAISFSVSVNAEDASTSAVEAFVAYSITTEAKEMFGDMVGYSGDSVTMTHTGSVIEDPYINYRMYVTDSYEDYLFIAKWFELAAEAAIELVGGTAYLGISYGDSTAAIDAIWNTASIRVALAYEIQQAINNGTDYYGVSTYTCIQFMNYFSLAADSSSNNPTTGYESTVLVDTDSISYVGQTVTTNDVAGYLASDEKMGLTYTLSYESLLKSISSGYARYLTSDCIVYGVDYIPSALSTSTTIGTNGTTSGATIYSTVTLNSSYMGDCSRDPVAGTTISSNNEASYIYDPATKTMTIYGVGDTEAYTTSGATAPWGSYIGEIETLIVKDGITSIGNWSFGTYATSLKEVYLADSVLEIWGNAFNGCTSLETLVLGGVINIRSRGLMNCSSLANVCSIYSSSDDPQIATVASATTSTQVSVLTSITIDDDSAKSLVTSDIKFHNKDYGTCVETVNGLDYCQCSVCSATFVTTEHDCDEYAVADDEVNKASTCLEKGWSGATKCSLCGAKIAAGSELTSYGACVTDGVYTIDKEATCTEDGEKSWYCTVCGDLIANSTVTIPATSDSHTFDDTTYQIVSASTCKDNGSATCDCTSCGKTITIVLDLDTSLHVDTDNSGYCDVCDAYMGTGSEAETELSFIDQIMAWINELIAAITALFANLGL